METQCFSPTQTNITLVLFIVYMLQFTDVNAQNEIDTIKVKGDITSYSVSDIEYIFGEGYKKFNGINNRMTTVSAKDGYKFIRIKGNFKGSQELIRFNKKDVVLSYKQNDSFHYCEVLYVESISLMFSQGEKDKSYSYVFNNPAILSLFFEIPDSIFDQFELKFIDTKLQLGNSSK